jgi:hypothetical protein
MLEQTLTDIEVLFIENGSMDGTLAVLNRYSGDSRVKVFSLPHPNLVDALNFGMAQARGKYLARMDADDYSLPERLERQVAFMEEHPDIGIAGTAAFFEYTGEPEPTIVRYPEKHADIIRQLNLPYTAPAFCHSTVMFCPERIPGKISYRRAFRHAEDYDLWLRLSHLCGMANLPEALLRYSPPLRSALRLRMPYIAFKSCVASWLDNYTQGKLWDRAACLKDGNIHLGELLACIDKRHHMAAASAMLCFAKNLGIAPRTLLRCRHIMQRCLAPEAEYDAMLFLSMTFFGDIIIPSPPVLLEADTQYRQGVLDFVAHVCAWQDSIAAHNDEGLSFQAILDTPSPCGLGDTPRILPVLMELLHRMRDSSRHDLSTRSGRLGWIGHVCQWIMPQMPWYQLPPWAVAALAQPSPTVENAAEDGITLLMEALWHGDPWLQEHYDLRLDFGRAALKQWFFDAGSPGLPKMG